MKNIRIMANFAILSDHCSNPGFGEVARVRKKDAQPTILLLQSSTDEKGSCLWHMPQVSYWSGEDDFIHQVNDIYIQTSVTCDWPQAFLKSPTGEFEPIVEPDRAKGCRFEQHYHLGHWETTSDGVVVLNQPNLVGYGWFTYKEARNLPMSESDQHALNLLKAQNKL